MARIIKKITITCPWCGGSADVRIWSCGCQTSDGTHSHEKCEGKQSGYFGKFEHDCRDFRTGPVRIPSFLKEQPLKHKP